MGLKDRGRQTLLAGKTLALVFEKPSLRTRVSFHVAMRHLGGDCIYLSPPEVGLGERETPADVARVLSRYVDCIAARTFRTETIAEIAPLGLCARDQRAFGRRAPVPGAGGPADRAGEEGRPETA